MARRDVYEYGFDEESGKTTAADTCPECGGALETGGGEISCTACGLVVNERRLDRGPDWRTHADEESDASRAGPPLTQARHDRGLSSRIGRKRDGKGNELSGRKRRQLGRLRREHSRGRYRCKQERNLATACSEIARMTSALDLPRSVREEASDLYRRAQAADLIVGRSIETIAAGCLYATCRRRGMPRSTAEVAAVARCDQGKVELGYRVLNVELGLDTPVIGPAERIPRLASECEAATAVRRRAAELAHLATEAGLANGRNPAGVAAACLYLAGQEAGADHTQSDLAALADVTPVTLRERYHELEALLAERSGE